MKLSAIACVLFVAFIGCTQTTPPPEPEAPTNELMGVWKAAELVDTDLDIPEMLEEKGIVMDESELVPDAYMIFTEKYGFVVGSAMPNRPELPENPTDAQLVAAWGPVWAFARTYEVKENTVIARLLFAKNPMAKLDEPEIHFFKFDGDDLIWTFGVNGGRNTATLRFTRLE